MGCGVQAEVLAVSGLYMAHWPDGPLERVLPAVATLAELGERRRRVIERRQARPSDPALELERAHEAMCQRDRCAVDAAEAVGAGRLGHVETWCRLWSQYDAELCWHVARARELRNQAPPAGRRAGEVG
jgi:hypothetical protein